MGKHFEKFEIIKRLNKGSSTFDPENYVGWTRQVNNIIHKTGHLRMKSSYPKLSKQGGEN